MRRRDFIATTVGGTSLVLPAGSYADADVKNRRTMMKNQRTKEKIFSYSDAATLPNFCAHEHWGSIDSIGMTKEGFRADTESGATPSRRTGIWDLILDPYLGWWISSTGVNVNAIAQNNGYNDITSWWEHAPEKTFLTIIPYVKQQLLTGTFQCTNHGIQFLHDVDIATFMFDDWKRADESIAGTYSTMFTWYQTAMKKAHFTELIRPVHPIFYHRKQDEKTSQEELSFTHTIMRIDPLLDLWEKDSLQRNNLTEMTGIEPSDASSWRAFLNRLFDIAHEHKTTGIKQLQAYKRTLDFEPQSDTDVTWRGDLTPDQITIFKNWVVNECCKQANERKWTQQIHVGTHNLPYSSPLPLESLARRYPNMNIVMIHCWPYVDEAGYLAKHNPNMYLDTCWTPVLNPNFFRQELTTWLNYVPTHKIMCSHDSTSIEMAVGSSLFTREILAECLATQGNTLGVTVSSLERIAIDMLQNNSVRIYGIGEEV